MKTKTILGISIAAILSISAVSVSTLPDAFAAKDFTGKPDFAALLEADQVPTHPDFPEIDGSESKAKGIALFWFNEDQTQLFYKIKLNRLNLDEKEGESPGNGATETVTKIHLHVAEFGTNGPHVLNVLGAPDRDDDDLEVNPTNGVLKGIWDDGDETDVPSESGRSKKLSEHLGSLCDDLIYVNVHSDLGDFENTVGAVRGQVIPVSNACE
jgi:hypothetical protein